MKKLFCSVIIAISCLCSQYAFAQELEVQRFQLKQNDLYARTHQVNDNNKVPCALIKVAIAGNDAEFSGSVIGRPIKYGGEYYVYVPANTQHIQISRPDYLPIDVRFADYGITIESLVTYELRINSPEISQTNQTMPLLQRQYVIFTVSPDDAVLYINGIPQPLENGKFEKELETGYYTYSVEAPFCESQSGEFTLTSDVKFRQNLALKENSGFLKISANDKLNARVFIDNVECGTTPMTSTRLSQGEHKIRLVMTGYEVAETSVEVQPNGKTTSVQVSLEPTFATVTLKAQSSDATITVDGKSPQKGTWKGTLDAGDHSVEISRTNYQSQTLIVTFLKGETKSVNLPELIPYYGIAKITSNPSGAKIYIDGVYAEDTPFNTNKITVGQHEIKAVMEGYPTQITKVTVKRDEELAVPFDMNKERSSFFSVKGTAQESGSDLSAKGTANCYVAKPNGEYSFKATVKGNSIRRVGIPSSADVLWESFGSNVKPNVGDVVKNVNYSNGRVTFTAGQEGNAVIAVRSSDGDILWSWHIWVTGADLEANKQTYIGGTVMMDRNLGALSATPGDYKALGLLYQWGRKDPFLGSSSISNRNSKAQATVSEPSPVKSNETTGTIDYITKNPTTFVTSINGNCDWYYTGNSSTDNTRWNSRKGIYDPCPPGWRVPDGGPNGVWTKAGFTDQTYDKNNEGILFGSRYSNPSAWYPAAGDRWSEDGGLYVVGNYGYYWSCLPNSYYAYYLYFSGNGNVDPQGNFYRANGQSVRCQKE